MMKRRASTCLVATVLAIAGCTGDLRDGEPTGSLSQAIVYGAPSGRDDDGVVLLGLGSSEDAFCTGVLVDARLVLTARHCLSVVGEGIFACSEDGHLALRSGEGGTFLADRPPAGVRVFLGSQRPSVERAPDALGAEIVHDGASVICGHDIGALILDRPIESARSFRLRAAGVEAGESLRVVGWGLDQTGERSASRRTRSDLPVARVGPAPDAPPHSSALTVGEFDFGESACDGDSGGAVLDVSSALVGVVSRGDGAKRDLAGPACFGAGAQTVASAVAVRHDLIRGWIARARGDDAAERAAPVQSGCSAGRSTRVAPWWPLLAWLCSWTMRRQRVARTRRSAQK